MAEKNIKGIKIEIGAETSGFQKALKSLNSETKKTQTELEQVNRLLKLDPSNTDLLTQKQTLLSRGIEQTQTKLDSLRKAKVTADAEMENGTEVNQEQYRKLQREIAATKNSLDNLKSQTQELDSKTNQAATSINNGFKSIGTEATNTKKDINKYSDEVDNASNKSITFGGVLSANVIADGFQAISEKAIESAKSIGTFYLDTEKVAGNMQAKLGLTAEESEKLKKVAEEVWAEGFGENIKDVSDGLATVKQNLKGISDDDLKNVTKGAYTISDAFGADVKESIAATKVMMDNFHISAGYALDIMTVGFQNGADYSGELIDTLREYSPQFASMGYSADSAMKMLIQGANNGAFSLDKVADANKEFNIRIKDGSKTTQDAVQKLGINYGDLTKKINDGSLSTSDAMQMVIKRLGSLDTATQNTTGVNLFGTQWEDVGAKAVMSLGNINTELENVNGATKKTGEALKQDIGSDVEKSLRKTKAEITTELVPSIQKITSTALPVAEKGLKLLANLTSGIIDNKTNLTMLITGVVTYSALVKGVEFAKYIKGLEGATTAQKIFNGALKDNAVGLAITGVTLLVTAISGYIAESKKEDEATKKRREEHEKQVKAIDDEVQAWNDLKKTADEKTQANLTEVGEIERLYDKLGTLTDSKGKVSKENQNQAEYIIGQLNPALGLEIEMVNGQIKGYQQVQKEIENVIKIKKGQSVLDASEEKYKNAIQNKTGTEKEQVDFKKQINDEKDRLAELKRVNDEYYEFYKTHGYYQNEVQTKWGKSTIQQVQKEGQELSKSLAEDEKAYDKKEKMIGDYYKTIQDYQNLEMEISKKNYANVDNLVRQQTNGFKTHSDATQQELMTQLETNYALYVERFRKSAQGIGNVTKESVDEAQKMVADSAEQLLLSGQKIPEFIANGIISNKIPVSSAITNAISFDLNSAASAGAAVGSAFVKEMASTLDAFSGIKVFGIGEIVKSTKSKLIPFMADGGVLEEGDAIVAEAGPEHIRIKNGRAIVTPLSGTSKNTAVNATGSKQINNYFTNSNFTNQQIAQILQMIENKLGGAY